jgi:glycolate oxidase FAD binding subunit
MDRPTTIEQLASLLRDHAAAGRAVRPRGGGTKLHWGGSGRARGAAEPVDLDVRGLDRVVEHNEGDFTAVIEAGMSLRAAQASFARAGQMLAIDPPLGDDDAATIGGVLATNDTGPMRHRYGGMRDLVLGTTVVLSDGTIARSGGKVIKNVAGYDLAKLFTGSFGTLGVVARVAVRLHPALPATATVVGMSDNADALMAGVALLARLPLEADCLDVAWSGGSGQLLVRFAGAAAEERGRAIVARLSALADVKIVTDDSAIWARQRASQRSTSPSGAVIKVSGRVTELPVILRAADAAGASVTSRAALGVSWLSLSDASNVDSLRRALAPRACTVLDGADRVDSPWPAVDPGALALMQRVKARFDPSHTFRPGAFVGGI